MSAQESTAPESPATITSEHNAVDPSAEQQFRGDLPTNDEPALAVVAPDDAFTGGFVEQPRAQQGRVIVPPVADAPASSGPNFRAYTEAETKTVAFKCLVPGAEHAFHQVLLRPGDTVAGAMDLYPLNDVSDDAKITMLPGSVVPAEAKGYVMSGYLDDRKRQMFSKK